GSGDGAGDAHLAAARNRADGASIVGRRFADVGRDERLVLLVKLRHGHVWTKAEDLALAPLLAIGGGQHVELVRLAQGRFAARPVGGMGDLGLGAKEIAVVAKANEDGDDIAHGFSPPTSLTND